MNSRPSTAAPILTVLAVVLVMLGAYVGGYVYFGSRDDYWDTFVPPPPGQGTVIGICRCYDRHWLAVVFYPASDIETWLRGIPVETARHPGTSAHSGWGIWHDFP